MKDKIILNDLAIIEIEAASESSNIRVLSQTKADMIATWDKLTDDNLRSVQIFNADGVLICEEKNLVLENETSEELKSGQILTSFRLRKKTEIELLKEEIEELKAGQQVQDTQIAGMSEELTGTQIGLAETYEMLEELAGGN